MLPIALDAMGGDHAPVETIKGTVLALQEKEDLFIILAGHRDIIRTELEKYKFPENRISILHAEEIIDNEMQPALALRRKKDSSMVKAINAVRDGEAGAIISAGNTGALLAGGLFILGRMQGIKRPALAAILPTEKNGHVVLLDVGATMDAKVEHLVQFALLGKSYSRLVLGKDKCRLALLNVGTEASKGNEQIKKAHKALKHMEEFIGNIEARDLMSGVADVVVCDGFTGNILLKGIEGVAGEIFSFLKKDVVSGWRGTFGGILLKPGFKKLQKHLDYSEYGGAPFLGTNGLLIKAHGSSQAYAIKNAILKQACSFIEKGCFKEMENYFAENQENSERRS